MDFLGNILSGQDLVNKDYVDKAIPVVPTKLSEFTDDILAGKYLPLAGGSISGNLAVQGQITANTLSVFGQNGMTVSRLVTSVVRSTSSIEFQAYNGTLGKANSIRLSTGQLAPIGEDKELISLGNANVRWKDVYAVGGDFSGVLNVQGLVAQEAAVGGKAVLTTGNYSDYALPLSGGTITSSSAVSPLCIDTTHASANYITFLSSGIAKSYVGWNPNLGAFLQNENDQFHIINGSAKLNGNTLLHSGNVGEYKAGDSNKLGGLNADSYLYSKEYYGDINAADLYGGRPFAMRLTSNNANLPPYMSYGNILYIGESDTGFMLAGSYSKDYLYFRRGMNKNNAGQNIHTNAWKTIAFTDSNVASATKLETARKLWGNNFDGTADVAAQLTFNANDAALSAWKKDGSSTSIFLQVNPDRHLLIGQGTARENGGLYLYGNDIRMCYGNAGSSSNTSMLINSSGNVTIGSSDLAGTNYRLFVHGKTKFISDANNLKLYTRINESDIQVGRTTANYTGGYNGGLSYGEDDTILGYIAGVFNYKGANITHFFYGGPAGSAVLNIKNGNVGIGTTSPSEKLHVVGKGLFTDILTAKGGINVTATEGALNTGQSGAAGVFLRNEGGIEISHASTPYIDFHHSAGTSDFNHRLIARADNIFAYSGNYFCPWGSESLGASSYRWRYVYAKAGNFSEDMEINGALTVGAGATFNGDVRINGNLVVTGDTASGGAGQETTSTSQLLVINQIIPEGTSVTQSALDAIGLTSDVIDDLIDGKYHHVLEVIGSNKSLYTISGYKSTTTREFILQYGSAEADTAWWYSFRQYNGGNWSVVFDEI